MHTRKGPVVLSSAYSNGIVRPDERDLAVAPTLQAFHRHAMAWPFRIRHFEKLVANRVVDTCHVRSSRDVQKRGLALEARRSDGACEQALPMSSHDASEAENVALMWHLLTGADAGNGGCVFVVVGTPKQTSSRRVLPLWVTGGSCVPLQPIACALSYRHGSPCSSISNGPYVTATRILGMFEMPSKI